MTLVVFLIDTSASMNQRTFPYRCSLLDVAKESVEKFIKVRQRDTAARGDRYMLLTFEEMPHNIKAGWKENHSTFIHELKNLAANSLTSINMGLKNTFDYLNLNRAHSGVDCYGNGRCPYYLESAIIIIFTDGCPYVTHNTVHEEIILPPKNFPGDELTHESYRWDQRVFAIVLRIRGVNKIDTSNSNQAVTCDSSPINQFCETTGGRSYCVTSKNEILWSLEHIASKMYNGVMVKFEKFGADPPMINGDDIQNEAYKNWNSTKNMIIVRPQQKGYSVGNWPIPEAYWPDPNLQSIPPRYSHPIIKFTCINSDPAVIDNLPFDKYELDSSPLTRFILSRKQPNVAWQVFVANSQRNSELGQPFGYLKASTSLNCVNLFVLPYNYPMLLPLLDDLFKKLQQRPTRDWQMQFDNYIKGLPSYYFIPLRRALSRMNCNGQVVNFIPEYDPFTSVTNVLKRYKGCAKSELDKLTQSGQEKAVNIEWPRITNIFNVITRKELNENFCKNPSLKKIFNHRKNEFDEFNGFIVRHEKEVKFKVYKNVKDISRDDLMKNLSKLKKMMSQQYYSKSLIFSGDDQKFHLPINLMGNYQEFLKTQPPALREIESAPSRSHIFGNPFKMDKNQKGLMIDEADDVVQNQSPKGQKRSNSMDLSQGPKPKRKPGPLPKDYFHRSSSQQQQQSPIYRPCPSPIPIQPQTYPPPPVSTIRVNLRTQAPPNYYPTNPMLMMNNNNGAPVMPSLLNNKMNNMKTNINNNMNNNNDFNKLVINVCNNANPNMININYNMTNNIINNDNSIPNNSDDIQFIEYNSIREENSLKNMYNNNKPVIMKPDSMPNGCVSIKNVTTTATMEPNNPLYYLYPYQQQYLEPDKKIQLSNHEIELIKSAFQYIRSNDVEKLFQIMFSQSGQFFDYLLYKIIDFARRFGRKNIIKLLSTHLGDKVEKALKIETKK